MADHTPSPDLLRTITEGASNFRDLGGLKARDGRRVRGGAVYRSDHLARLTAEGARALPALPVRFSADFRGVQERAATPYAIEGVRVLPLSVEPSVFRRLNAFMQDGAVPSTEQTVDMMCETYRDFVTEHAPTFGHLLRHLAAHDDPLVFHCTAGKDRTGYAAALLLSVLGVERDSIMDDYLLTNRLYRRDPGAEGHGPAHVMNVLWQVQPAFLHAAFDEIDQRHGGVQRYLLGPAGLSAAELQALRERLLAD
jgi:protein-tyrosine phosphatase